MGALLTSIMLALGLGTVAAQPAQAGATGHVYLVVFNSRCVSGGTVKQITGAVDWVWSGGDYGDNIIYPRVEFHRWNAFNGRALCVNGSKSYWINIPYWQFYPTAWNQAFYY